MQGKLAFGRRKLNKLAKPEEGEKTCRAGACAYAAVLEATRFKSEAILKGKPKLKSAGACDHLSSLYDSFELDSFSSQLGHCLAEERRHAHVAQQKSDLAASWHRRRSNVAPRWQSRRQSISCCPFTFPSCFPKRTPTIQLGKRKKPSLHSALHVIAKVARRGCHVIAALPACTTHGDVKQPQKLRQTHHHYHHHLHHYTIETPSKARECCEDRNHNEGPFEVCDSDRIFRCDTERERNLSKASSEHLQPQMPTTLLSPNTLAYLPLEEIDPHLTSIKYHS